MGRRKRICFSGGVHAAAIANKGGGGGGGLGSGPEGHKTGSSEPTRGGGIPIPIIEKGPIDRMSDRSNFHAS